MTTFEFENTIVNLAEYPPPPVVWALALVDTLCGPLGCSQWRQTMEVPHDSWLSHEVPAIIDYKPKLSSYSSGSPWSPTEVYKYAFETPSTELGDLTTPMAMMVVLILLILLRHFNSVLIPFLSSLGRESALQYRGEKWVNANGCKIVKFGETAYQLLAHGTLALYGISFFHSEVWWAQDGFMRFSGTKALFLGFPHHSVQPDMAWFYILQAVYNLDALISLLRISFAIQFQWPVVFSHIKTSTRSPSGGVIIPFFYYWRSPVVICWNKTVRSDFVEMAFHDILTNFLAFGSSCMRLTRAGSMVFLVHDVSAVTVKISKLANFLEWGENVKLTAFSTMLITWFITRLYILPFVILRGIILYQHHILETGVSPILFICYRHIFTVGVALLCMLQLYWFNSYIKIYLKMIKKMKMAKKPV